MSESQPSGIQDPALAHIMGYAEYPYMETARMAEEQGMPQIATELRDRATLAGVEAASMWITDLGREVLRAKQQTLASEALPPMEEQVSVNGNEQSDRKLNDVLARLRDVRDASQRLNNELNDTALEAREVGATWSQIAHAVGVSQQTAHQRWSERGRESHRVAQRNRTIRSE